MTKEKHQILLELESTEQVEQVAKELMKIIPKEQYKNIYVNDYDDISDIFEIKKEKDEKSRIN